MRALFAQVQSLPSDPSRIAAIAGRALAALTFAPGPEGRVWTGPSAALGAILPPQTPEDTFDIQPLVSGSGNLILVTDALLENRPELAAALGWDAVRAAHSADSAYVLASYERWGPDCVHRLEGAWAFAVWDACAQRLDCAVDALGRSSLYFRPEADGVVIASTLRAIFATSSATHALNPDALAAFVARLPASSPSATIYRDIGQVPPGHRLSWTPRELRLHRYWQPDPQRELRLASDAEYLEAFRAEFSRATRDALSRTHGGVGILLSGGLDSSALAAEAGRQLSLQGRRLQALHLLPSHDRAPAELRHREFDESLFARALRDHAPHIDFHFVANRSDHLPPEEWDTFFDTHQVPFVGFPGRSDPALETLINQLDLELMLDGGGGNYLISLEGLPSGYLSHLFCRGRWIAWLRECLGRARVYGDPLWPTLRGTSVGSLRRRLSRPKISPAHPVHLLAPDLRARTGIISRLEHCQLEWTPPAWDFRRHLYRVLTEVAPVPFGNVRESAIAGGAPPRRRVSPLFDRRLNEFCLALPMAQQVRDGVDRRLLREAMRGALPESVRLRTTRGFPQPGAVRLLQNLAPRLQNELRHLARHHAVSEWLDLTWAENGISADTPTLRRLLDSVLLGRYLVWASKH